MTSVETTITSILDVFPSLRKKETKQEINNYLNMCLSLYSKF